MSDLMSERRIWVERRPGIWPWRYEVWDNRHHFDLWNFSSGVNRRYLTKKAALLRRDYLLNRLVVDE